MDTFPAFFPLSGRTVIVAGDVELADAKARLFEGSPARLVRLSAAQAQAANAFDGALLVFIAGDQDFCAEAAERARASGALVNVVDRPALSDFNTPAVIDRGEVVVGIGTAGAAPMMAALLRNDLETRVPEGAGRVAALFKRLQEEVRAAFPDLADRRAYLREAFTSSAAEAAARGDMAAAETLLRQSLTQPRAPRVGRLALISGADASLLSLRAVTALGQADVVVATTDVDPAVAGLARRDARRIAQTLGPAELANLARKYQVMAIVSDVPKLADALTAYGLEFDILPVAQDPKV